MKTDKAWEIWGARDPYYAVLTDERFRVDALGTPDREAFFRSGASHVAWLLTHLAQPARRDAVLDFGCGVGRLLIPFAARFDTVTGVDVSRSMLDEARRNCADAGVANVELLTTDRLLETDDPYDLVHSVLVFQHLRRRSAEHLLDALAQRVAPGGVLAVQLLFRSAAGGGALAWLKNRLPYGYVLAGRLRGRPAVTAPMEMNPVAMNRVLEILQDRGFDEVRVLLSRDGALGSAFVVCTRPGAAGDGVALAAIPR